ncbi:hypothetical protein B0H11DRAFT_2250685 [Mycena galericulata]|nr:hypothetical protein B0H11DRAFT_2254765 [Mycena galericulata]KAJ7443510.1 hypothetical protein B0H11DRAFT_2250685 [Mycena galericulata]
MLLDICGPYFFDTTFFCEMRRTLYMVCRDWFRIIRSTHAFWSSIRINRSQTTDYIEYLLRRSRRGTIHLALRFDEAPQPAFPGPYHNPPVAFIINVVLPHFRRVKSLAIFPGNTDAMMMLRHHLPHTVMPALETILVYRPLEVPSVYAVPTILYPTFQNTLRCIDICALAFDFSTLPTLPNVDRLVLRAVRSQDFPTWNNMLALLRSMPSVRFLSLDGVGCRSAPLDVPSLNLLPALQELHLSFRNTKNLHTLVSAMTFPSMKSLYFTSYSPHDFALLRKCEPLLPPLRLLAFDGPPPPLSDLVALLNSASCLTDLHAPYAGGVVLDALRAASAPELIVPKLEVVGLGFVSPTHILPFAQSWTSRSSVLRRVVLWTPLPIDRLPFDAALPLLENQFDVQIQLAFPIAAWHFKNIAAPFTFSI